MGERVILVDENDREIGSEEKLAAHQNGGKLHRAVSIYVFHPDGRLGWDIIFSAKYYNKIARLLLLPLKQKNKNRVKHAQRLGKLAVEQNRLEIKKGSVICNI